MAGLNHHPQRAAEPVSGVTVPTRSVRQSERWLVKLGIWAVGYDRLLGWYRSTKSLWGQTKAVLRGPSRRVLQRRAQLICDLKAESAQAANGSGDRAESQAASRPVSDLKIALLIPAFQMGKGGAEKVAGRLAEALARAGSTVHLFCRPPTAAAPPYPVDSRVRIRNGLETDETHVGQLASDRFDLLIGFGMPGFYARIAGISRQLDVPFVIQECNNPGYIARSLCGTHVCQSEEEAYWLRQAVFAHAAAVRLTVPQYAESVESDIRPFVHAFYNALASVRTDRKTPAKKFICVGAMKKKTKNGLAALQAFCAFSRQHLDWSLHLYGENHYRSETRKLKERFPRAAIADHGTVDDVDAIYDGAYALIIPSYDEGLPNVVVEAFSYGVPCIGFSDCCGVKHLISHEETGLLVDRGQPHGLEGALERIVDPTLHSRLSDNAARFAEENLQAETWEANWLHLIGHAANHLDANARPRRPAAYDSSTPRASHWRELLNTYLYFSD